MKHSKRLVTVAFEFNIGFAIKYKSKRNNNLGWVPIRVFPTYLPATHDQTLLTTNLVKWNLEEMQGKTQSSLPHPRYLFYSCREFLPNQNVRNKPLIVFGPGLSSFRSQVRLLTCQWCRYRISVEPGDEAVPQSKDGTTSSSPNTFTNEIWPFKCDRVHPLVQVIIKF